MEKLTRPKLFTFDIFGTVLDWQSGLSQALRAQGKTFRDGDMERFNDIQGKLESGPYRTYRELTALTLTQGFGIEPAKADAVAAKVGEWPLFRDSVEGMKRLMAIAPCAAMTNSDLAHGEQVQKQLGYRLSDWICAEEVRVYKPSVEFWKAVAKRRGIAFNRDWWHVSAYANFDLDVTWKLGLTCVYIPRPHHRAGKAHHTAADLNALADFLQAGSPASRGGGS